MVRSFLASYERRSINFGCILPDAPQSRNIASPATETPTPNVNGNRKSGNGPTTSALNVRRRHRASPKRRGSMMYFKPSPINRLLRIKTILERLRLLVKPCLTKIAARAIVAIRTNIESETFFDNSQIAAPFGASPFRALATKRPSTIAPVIYGSPLMVSPPARVTIES